jgi:hypothetical protein
MFSELVESLGVYMETSMLGSNYLHIDKMRITNNFERLRGANENLLLHDNSMSSRNQGKSKDNFSSSAADYILPPVFPFYDASILELTNDDIEMSAL